MAKLLKRAYQKRGDDLIKRGASFAQSVYRDAMKKHLVQIEALPDGWLPRDHYINVQLGAEVKQLYFVGTLDNWDIPEIFRIAGIVRDDTREYMSFPALLKSQVVKQYPGDHTLVAEFQKLDNEWNELKTEMERAKKVAMAAMNSVSTVKKLIEVWPEVEEFAKHYLEDGERKAILPAIPRDQLNTLLNLPPEEQVA